MLQKYWQKKASGKKGFTLIEMIVVIAILIILMALMVPLLSKYLKQATDAKNQSNARAVYTAAAAHAADQMSSNGSIIKTNLDGNDLKVYFSGTETDIGATIDANTGAVIEARYKSSYYPPR